MVDDHEVAWEFGWRPQGGVGEVTDAFRKWTWLPDPTPLLAVLGTIAANHLDGDPVWTVLVGPPGGGKTEIIQSNRTIPHVRVAATITEAALLSGTPKREKASDTKGGLLKEIG